MSRRRGLVLGGGGVTGIAWETGLLLGLQEAGLDVTGADLVVGTSAGSVVGAQVTTGVPIDELFARQLAPPAPGPVASIGPGVLLGFARAMLRARGDLQEFGRHVGQWSIRRADAGRTPSLEERLAAIGERLPVQVWAGRPFLVTAVDATSGALRVLDEASGVPLVRAVAASCAVPGVYPPVPIEGIPYVDGGARSGANADLARDCDRVLALTPVARGVGPLRSAGEQLAGVAHLVVSPDADSRTAIGRNVLDPAARAAAARAGHAQAGRVVDRAASIWS
jgi:NTE family protein